MTLTFSRQRTSTRTSSSDSFSLYTSTVQSFPLCKCSTPALPLPLNLLFPFCPLRIFSLCTPFTASCFWLFLYTSCFLFIHRLPQGSSMKWWGVSESGVPSFYILFHLIPVTLFVSRNLTLIYLSLYEPLNPVLCDLITLTPSLASSLPMPRTLAAASSLSSGRDYPSLNFLSFLCA